MNNRIGILGVGELAAYLVRGLIRGGNHPPLSFSPRNADKARALARECGAKVCANNAELVAESELVIVATRPDQVGGALRDLPWRPTHTLISVAAGVTLAALREVASPATLVRAMPVSCAAIGESPTAMHPRNARAQALFAQLGPVQVLADERAFQAASVLGAYYGWVFALMAEVGRWAESAGVPPPQARALVAGMTRGAGAAALNDPESSPAEMLSALRTPGGITEHGLRALQENGGLAGWTQACASVFTVGPR